MKKSNSSISKANTYKEISNFWDTHSLADYWDQTKPVEFDVEIQSEVILYPLDNNLDSQIRRIAKRKGMRPEKLLTIWIQEKLQNA